MGEAGILYTAGKYWVSNEGSKSNPSYHVWKDGTTHATADSAYSDLSLAISRTEYLNKRQMPNAPKPIRPPWVPERKPFARRKDNSKFYNGRKWRKFSKAFREKNPLCVQCEEEGRTTAAAVCDHIRGLDFLLENNLDPMAEKECQSLCHPCHNKKSGREAHGKRENLKP